MQGIRLKTNLSEKSVQDRLRRHPEIVEFHLELGDLEEDRLLRSRIRQFKAEGIRVYLHQPPKRAGVFWDLLTADTSFYHAYLECSRRLAAVCGDEEVRSVIHAHYRYDSEESYRRLTPENSMRMRERIETVLDFAGDRFMWEDTTGGLFSYANPYLMSSVIEPLGLPLNVDVSHSFIALRGDNDRLRQVLEATLPYAVYYHLVDSMGEEHDSLPLGKGKIDWSMVKPFVEGKEYIFEINLPGDHSDCTLMLESADYFQKVRAIRTAL